ncbi:MAG TPA: DUF3175 domain-containing protein [Bryobacteraceae bacterium]|nr:DUF3175 domain-containing protein [Bryobacteraceae bacterium]
MPSHKSRVTAGDIKARPRTPAPAKPIQAKRASPNRWSKHVMETSNALDLEANVFKLRSARRIAASLKRSAESSKRRKATPFQSAMSMLNFYINRAGHNLPERQKRVLENAKAELRRLFGKKEPTASG